MGIDGVSSRGNESTGIAGSFCFGSFGYVVCCLRGADYVNNVRVMGCDEVAIQAGVYGITCCILS